MLNMETSVYSLQDIVTTLKKFNKQLDNDYLPDITLMFASELTGLSEDKLYELMQGKND